MLLSLSFAYFWQDYSPPNFMVATPLKLQFEYPVLHDESQKLEFHVPPALQCYSMNLHQCTPSALQKK